MYTNVLTGRTTSVTVLRRFEGRLSDDGGGDAVKLDKPSLENSESSDLRGISLLEDMSNVDS